MNLDCVDLPGVDVVHDLEDLPLPFNDNAFDEIVCKDILEHMAQPNQLMAELHRILRKGGSLRVRVPHFTSKDAFSDPTHRCFFSVHTFRYFTQDHSRSYYYDFAFSEQRSVKLAFDTRPIYPYNWLLQRFVNISVRTQNFYEGSPLRVFPATNIEVELIK